MKPIVIRQELAWIILLFSPIVVGFAFCGINAGMQAWQVWAVIAFGVICFVGGFIGVNHTDTFSEEGITSSGLFGKKTIPWSDVIQVKTYWVTHAVRGGLRGRDIKYLGFTFKGGQPMRQVQNPTQWMMKNLTTSMGVTYRKDLEELVLRYYGPLDDKVFWSPTNQ